MGSGGKPVEIEDVIVYPAGTIPDRFGRLGIGARKRLCQQLKEGITLQGLRPGQQGIQRIHIAAEMIFVVDADGFPVDKRLQCRRAVRERGKDERIVIGHCCLRKVRIGSKTAYAAGVCRVKG